MAYEGVHPKVFQHVMLHPSLLIVHDIGHTPFVVRVVPQGGHYGRDFALRNDDDPMVEFYDARYAHSPFGQFVSRYYFSTLEGRQGGLNLQGGVPAWVASDRQIALAVAHAESVLMRGPLQENLIEFDKDTRRLVSTAAGALIPLQERLAKPESCCWPRELSGLDRLPQLEEGLPVMLVADLANLSSSTKPGAQVMRTAGNVVTVRFYDGSVMDVPRDEIEVDLDAVAHRQFVSANFPTVSHFDRIRLADHLVELPTESVVALEQHYPDSARGHHICRLATDYVGRLLMQVEPPHYIRPPFGPGHACAELQREPFASRCAWTMLACGELTEGSSWVGKIIAEAAPYGQEAARRAECEWQESALALGSSTAVEQAEHELWLARNFAARFGVEFPVQATAPGPRP